MNGGATSSALKEMLIEIEDILGKGETWGNDLSALAKKLFGDKFVGIFEVPSLSVSTSLPTLKEGQVAIINKDEHWLGVYRKNGKLFEVDSFEMENFGRKYKNFNFPDSFRQKIFETNCGQRLLVLLYLAMNK